MTEVIVWTAIFFGGDLAVVIFLLSYAVRKDKRKAAEESPESS